MEKMRFANTYCENIGCLPNPFSHKCSLTGSFTEDKNVSVLKTGTNGNFLNSLCNHFNILQSINQNPVSLERTGRNHIKL